MNKKILKTTLKGIAIGIIVGALISTIILGVKFSLQGRIPPGVIIASVDIGYKTPKDAAKLLKEKEQTYLEEPLKFFFNGKLVAIQPQEIGLKYFVEETISTINRIDLKTHSFTQELQKASGENPIEILYDFDEKSLRSILDEKFALPDIAPKNAVYFINDQQRLDIKKEQDGKIINYNQVLNQIKTALLQMEPIKIKLVLEDAKPTLLYTDLEKAKAEIVDELKHKVKITYDDNNWDFTPIEHLDWIEFVEKSQTTLPYLDFTVDLPVDYSAAQGASVTDTNSSTITTSSDTASLISEPLATETPTTTSEGQSSPEIPALPTTTSPQSPSIERTIGISISEKKLNEYIDALVAKEVEIVVDPVSIYKDEAGKIVIKGKGEDGKLIQREYLKKALELAVENKIKEVPIQVRTIKAPITISKEIQDMGIKELVAVGHTSYYGSPPNRIYNIQVGVNHFNGTLIPQGAEFSFNKTLGKVDGSTGYKKELTITKIGTVPEYGGGLCQVSTTMYRAAIFAGLKITARAPHSYAVSYYSQTLGYGLDATIYLCGQDLKFINDTPGPILVQGYVEDENAYFKFYGTGDGRKVVMDGPYLDNYKYPPEDIIYEVDNSLAIGEKKKVEKRHVGFEATWYRTIISPDCTENKETIFSHYQSTQEKYLMGPEG